ncbi:conserved Plasmodium protein, unknown function [Plasmodium relictum]|uniref:Uncharacterized protein n=1 Tax=Plasmodium relictum TaxID=85471 RepID=A0A1J1HCJ1_PLARL|nr:conserved Plasmodium protein, unknown function [Plasmodium relictum]CRH01140.1 conserved Plasmodium protein, unknown function [Plasmodium relictum]
MDKINLLQELNDENRKKNKLNENILNFDFSYESILNNDIKRPQEIDCGMSCTSSFFDSNEKVINENIYNKNLNNDYSNCDNIIYNNIYNNYNNNDLNGASYDANHSIAYNSNALDVSFQKKNELNVNEFLNIEKNRSNEKNNFNTSENNKKEKNDENDNILHENTIMNNLNICNDNNILLNNDNFIIKNVNDINQKIICNRNDTNINSNNLNNNANNTIYDLDKKGESTFKNKEDSFINHDKNDNEKCDIINNDSNKKSQENDLFITENEKEHFLNENNKSRSNTSTYIICSQKNSSSNINETMVNSNNSTSGISKNKNDNVIILNNEDNMNKDDINIKEIYDIVENDIINYKNIIFQMKSELQIRNCYLENEKRKNEEYEKIIGNYINELNSYSNKSNSLESLNIIEIENKQLKQELILKNSEIIELNNIINNLKSQKNIFFNCLENELEISLKKETECSLILHAQTKRLNNANCFIEKQNIKIRELKKEMEKLEETYVTHVKKNEKQIEELLKEKEEFIKITKELEVINIDNKNKKEEIDKYKNKCQELNDELNDLLRLVASNQQDKVNFENFYQNNKYDSFNFMNESYNNSNTVIGDNNILKNQLKKLIEENDKLKKELDELKNNNLNIINELKKKSEMIKEKDMNYSVLLEKYNILEKDYENIHNLCIILENKYREEYNNNSIHKNINILSKSNFSLSELELNHSQQSENDINNYKIYCSELKLENESLKSIIEKLKIKNKKLSKNMEFLLNDLINAETLNEDNSNNKSTNHNNTDNIECNNNSNNELINDNEKCDIRNSSNINLLIDNNNINKINISKINNYSQTKENISNDKKIDNFTQTSEKISINEKIDNFTQTNEQISINEKIDNFTQTNEHISNDEKTDNFTQTNEQISINEKIDNFTQTNEHISNDEKTDNLTQNNEHISDDKKNNHLINEGVNTEEKIVFDKDTYTSDNVLLVSSYINTRKIDLIDKSINTNENIKEFTNNCSQTDEINSYIKSTQTDIIKNIDREVITNIYGISNFNIKKMMMKCNFSKNKKIQVTTTSMNASTQTKEIFSNLIDKYSSSDEYNIYKRYKKKKKIKDFSSLYSSNTSNSFFFKESDSSNDLSLIRRKKNKYNNKNKYYNYDNNYENYLCKNKNYKFTNRDKNYILSFDKKKYYKENDVLDNYSELYSKMNKKERYKDYNRNEDKEVESLIEILKYSSENDDSFYIDNVYNTKQKEMIKQKKREIEEIEKLKEERRRERNIKKKKKDIYRKHQNDVNYKNVYSSEDYYDYAYSNKNKLLAQKIKRNKIKKNMYNYNHIIKTENKYVQTTEYFLNCDIYYEQKENVKFPKFSDNVLILKNKIKDYSKNLYYNVIVCENCNGFYIDLLLINIFNEYINYYNCCNNCALKKKIFEKKNINKDKFMHNSESSIKNNSSIFNLENFSTSKNDVIFTLKKKKKEEMEEEKEKQETNQYYNVYNIKDGYCSEKSEYSNDMNDSYENSSIDDNEVKNSETDEYNDLYESSRLSKGEKKRNCKIENFIIKHIPFKLHICTCAYINVKYKKMLIRKEEIKRNNKIKKKKKDVCNNNLFFNQIFNFISKIKNELNEVKFIIQNFFYLNKNNILGNFILNTKKINDIPLFLFNYVENKNISYVKNGENSYINENEAVINKHNSQVSCHSLNTYCLEEAYTANQQIVNSCNYQKNFNNFINSNNSNLVHFNLRDTYDPKKTSNINKIMKDNDNDKKSYELSNDSENQNKYCGNINYSFIKDKINEDKMKTIYDYSIINRNDQNISLYYPNMNYDDIKIHFNEKNYKKGKVCNFNDLMQKYEIKNIMIFFICCLFYLNELYIKNTSSFKEFQTCDIKCEDSKNENDIQLNNNIHNDRCYNIDDANYNDGSIKKKCNFYNTNHSKDDNIINSNKMCDSINLNERKCNSLNHKEQSKLNTNNINEIEIFLEKYNSVNVINEKKENNLLFDVVNDILNNIKKNSESICSVYILMNEKINIEELKISDLYKLIDNYTKIEVYISNLNKVCREKVKSLENIINECNSNKEEIINIHKEKIINTEKLVEEKDSIINDLKLEVEILLKDKEITNNLLNEVTEEKNRYFNLYIDFQNSIIQKDKLPDNEENELKNNNSNNNKINSCINKINELNKEINLLKKKGKLSPVNNNNNESSSSYNNSHICKKEQNEEKNFDNLVSNNILNNKLLSKKRIEKKCKLNKMDVLFNLEMKKIFKIFFILKEKIIVFASYIYKKLYKNIPINIYYVKQYYTNIINLFLNLPKHINVNFLFINENEINYNIYLKKNFKKNYNILALTDNSFNDFSDDSSLETKIIQDKKKNKIKYEKSRQDYRDNTTQKKKNKNKNIHLGSMEQSDKVIKKKKKIL